MTAPGIYRHNKTGNMYKVLGTPIVATNGEQNGKRVVLYEPSPQHGTDQYVRDEAEFNEPGRFTFWASDTEYEEETDTESGTGDRGPSRFLIGDKQ